MAFYLDASLMFFNDPMADGESQTCSLAHLLGGEKGSKIFALRCSGMPFPVSLMLIRTKSLALDCGDRNRPLTLNGINGVGEYIHKYLIQLSGVTFKHR
jgi:hypothetical protein